MTLFKLTSWIIASTVFILCQSSFVYAAKTTETTHYPTMIVFNLDKQDISHDFLQKCDLKNTLIQLSATNKSDAVQAKMRDAIKQLVAKANHYSLMLGIVIESAAPLNTQSAHDIAQIAGKSTFISTLFSLQEVKDWQSIFTAEQKNANLLTVVYGESAMQQLQAAPEMGASLANTGLAFLHFFVPDETSEKSALSFWDNFAQTLKSTKHPTGIIVLESGLPHTLDYDEIVKSSVNQGDGYLFWIGDKDAQKFKPATLNAPQLSLWRKYDDSVKHFSYVRTHTPEALYSALGASQQSYEMLSFLSDRSKKAMNAGIDLTSDAETNIHALGVLIDFANTVVGQNNNLFLPPDINAVTLSRLNILILDPTKDTVHKLGDDSMMLKESIMQQDYLGVFDYSNTDSAVFYTKLASFITNFPGVSIQYNTANLKNLETMLSMAETLKAKEISLGPEATMLYMHEDNATLKKLTTDVKINLYAD